MERTQPLILEYSYSYDVEVIVSGWGGDSTKSLGASILSASRDGVTLHSIEGFYTCGSGSETAHSILSFFNQQSHMTLAETVYHVTAAKFMSERTAGVGPRTLLRIATRAGNSSDQWNGYFVQMDEIEEIRQLWKKYTTSVIPPEAEDKIVTILGKRGKLHVSQDHMVRRINDSLDYQKRGPG